jgi:hypothetical protein
VRSNPPPPNPKHTADKTKAVVDKAKVDKGKALAHELRSITKETPGYGSGNYSIDLDEYELAGAHELQLKLLSIFRSPHYKPPVLPNIALELTDLSKKQTSRTTTWCA